MGEKLFEKVECEYCDESGHLEMDNNGPIVLCPVCKGAKVRLVPVNEE